MSSQRTFRLSFIQRRIISICQSRALRAALLAALNGGPDAALMVEMVERVRPPARLPIQVVTPVPQREETSEEETSEEETSEEELDTPAQSEGETSEEELDTPAQSPPRQETQNSPQETRDTGNTVILIEDSDSDRD